MESVKKSYKQIIKTTSLFGGVQVIQILTTIVRGKLVALLLGATGMGINTLYNSVVTMIVQFSSFGLNFSAVRDISQASERDDTDVQNRTIIVFRRWMIFCAILGITIICLGSKWLSSFTFGNDKYTWGFVWLSIVVVLTILNSANITVLQGTRKLKEMAKASVAGSIIGLVFCVPFYYFYREGGIIPALIISAFSTFVLSWYFSSRVNVSSSAITMQDTIKEGSEMAKLGFAMMLATLIGSAVNYAINAYISNYGSIADVGLFGAGMSITNQYVGVIFTAMSVDYFPRLSAVCNDKVKVNDMVNQQAEIVLLMVAPILITMMLSAPIIIRVLLSPQFSVINDFVCWAAYAMLFKAASFAMGYISFAKGDKKTFFLFEGVFNSLIILLSGIVGYNVGGINGIGIGMVISNILYILNINVLSNMRYGFQLSRSLLTIFLFSILLLSLVLITVLFYANIYGYIFGALLLIISAFYSFKELDHRIQLKSFLLSKIKGRSKIA